MQPPLLPLFFFFFNDTATTEIYTLSLHDALPIWAGEEIEALRKAGVDYEIVPGVTAALGAAAVAGIDRKSTRLNSSHLVISYAVFCLKKKTNDDRSSGLSSRPR